jgi:hypothetical protein
MASHDSPNPFAPCCLGSNCRLVDLTNGAFPLAAASRNCVVCNGVLHPLCGEIDSRSSLLTCFNCIEAYGQTFENHESAALFVGGLQVQPRVETNQQEEVLLPPMKVSTSAL